MKLPEMPYQSGYQKSVQTTFGGYNHTEGAGDGEIYDMKNMTSDHYPLLASRSPRYSKEEIAADNGLIYVGDDCYRVSGTALYHNDKAIGTVADSFKRFAAMRYYLVIYPDKIAVRLGMKGYYDYLDHLKDKVDAPEINDRYVVGTKVYYWDGTVWKVEKGYYSDLATLTAEETTAVSDDRYVVGSKLYCWDGAKWAEGGSVAEPKGYYADLTTLTASVTEASQNDRYVVGAKVYYWDGEDWTILGNQVEPLESEWSGALSFLADGEYEGESAADNTIYNADVTWSEYFRAGDAVEISGCTKHEENNMSIIIKEVNENNLRFYENSFVLDNKYVYTAGDDGLLLGKRDSKYQIGIDGWFGVTQTGSYYYVGALEKYSYYSLIYNNITYSFYVEYDDIYYLEFQSSNKTVYLYTASGIKTVSTVSEQTASYKTISLITGNGTSSLPMSFNVNGTWYTITPTNNIQSSPPPYFIYDSLDNSVEIYVPEEQGFWNYVLSETITATKEKTGADITSVSSYKSFEPVYYSFDTEDKRVIFKLGEYLAEGETLIWNNNCLNQQNYGNLEYNGCTLIKTSKINENVYRSISDTWEVGNYCIIAGDNSLYLYIHSNEIETTDEGYFIYNGIELLYRHGVVTTTISTSLYNTNTYSKMLSFSLKSIDHIETTITLKRSVPDLDLIMAHDNRLWGCKDDTIYASKPGDPFNFNVFDGLSTDSYAVQSGSPEDFTAVYSYLGYPIFFKENHIYRIYGDTASEFTIYDSASRGVAAGSGASLAMANETLYYMSKTGVMAYTGGTPSLVSASWGLNRYQNGIGGSDGNKYYLDLVDGTEHRLFVYDPLRNMWHIESSPEIQTFFFADGETWFLDKEGKRWTLSALTASKGTFKDLAALNAGVTKPAINDYYTAGSSLYSWDGQAWVIQAETEAVSWMVEFADITYKSPNKKTLAKIQIRCEVEGDIHADVQFDGGNWQQCYSSTSMNKQSKVIPIIPMRTDHFKIKLTGTGAVKINSLAMAYKSGSDQ